MPNHVRNVITLHGEQAEIRRLREAVMVNGLGLGTVDFEKILPMPNDIYRGLLGELEMQQYGDKNWFDWSVKNWGTKWNAYDFDVKAGEDKLVFYTAWTPPHPVLKRLSQMFPEVEVEHHWANEALDLNSGRRVYQNGAISAENVPEDEAEIYRMSCEIWGIDPETEILDELEFTMS